MVFLITFLSFLFLIILHELGHFLFAKKFNVKVEEFGIGLPPRLFGKKIGETIYSLNLLPLGAFVRLQGEEEVMNDPRSFSIKPIWQRMIIVAAGVAAFWLVSAVIFTGLGATSGIPLAVSDDQTQNISNPQVQIIGIAKDSPADNAGLLAGDIISEMKASEESKVEPTKVAEVQAFTEEFQGQEMTLVVQRGTETKEVRVLARSNPPQGEGAIGVALVRSGFVQYAWYEAPWQGIKHTAEFTSAIIQNLVGLAANLIQGKGVPQGVEFMGPVGIFQLLSNSFSLGVAHFFSFLALLSLYLAIFNALPLPVVDGGKLLFLGLEAVFRKPVPQAFERNLSTIFFFLLITLMIWVTIRDIDRLF